MNFSYETFNSYFNADHLQSASLILTMKHDANEAKKKDWSNMILLQEKIKSSVNRYTWTTAKKS